METLHNLADQRSGFIERSNAWYVSERPVTREDYVNGQAYLEWYLTFKAFGVWHKAFFVTKKIDPILDLDLGVVGSPDVAVSEVASSCDGYHSPVFVDQVELVKIDKCACPSWVWFQITNNPLRGFAGFPNFVYQPVFKVGAVAGRGESGIVRRPPGGYRASGNEVVEGCSKIVRGVPNRHGNLRWQRLREGYVEAMLVRTKVTFMANAVRVLTEIPENEVIHLADVRLRALQLQQRA